MFLGKKETVVNVVDIDMVLDPNNISSEAPVEISESTTKEKFSEFIK